MSEREDLTSALHAAGDAGDDEAAKHFAEALSKLGDDTKLAAPAPIPKNKEKKDIWKYQQDPGTPEGPSPAGVMAKSAWNATKSLMLGANQISDAVTQPIVRKMGDLMGNKEIGKNIDKYNASAEAARKAVNEDQSRQQQESPFDAVVGNALPMTAIAGPMTPELGVAGAAGRVLNSAVGAGAASALEPVDPSGNMARQKAEQFGLGAALGGAGAGLAEAGSMGKNFVNKHVLFGDVGTAETPVQKYWQKAKDMGFNISPQQARQDAGRIQTPGVTFSQREQNRLAGNLEATRAAGAPSGVIDKAYIGSNFERLGKEYDKVYAPGTSFKVDGDAIAQLQDFVSNSTAAQLGSPWANKEAMTAANKLLDAYHSAAADYGITGRGFKLKVDGATVNRLVSELKSSSAKIKDGFQREDLGEVINAINESVARNNPSVKVALDKINPQYRTMKTLENLSQRGGIDANGNISPADLARFLRAGNDRGYVRGHSTHPLNDLAEVGETFGLRAISQPEISGGQTSRGVDLPTSRSGLLQKAVETGKEHLPGFQSGFNRYKLGESGHGLDRSEQKTIADIAAVAKMSEDQRENTDR
jgi:hypothetical protein